MSKNQKQNFLQGAALLALAVAIVKVIGAIYKIPLATILGDVGFSYFSTAYEIYTLLLTISTAGLPIAMSRLISQAYSLGQSNRVRQVYKVSKTIFLIIGLVCTLIMAVFCTVLANLMGQSGAWVAILCLSPCALLMGYMSAYRGFFQGQGDMAPTSTSQVLEAVVKLVVGLSVAFLLKKLTDSSILAAGGAIIGVTVSCLFSAVYLRKKLTPAYEGLELSAETVESFRQTAGRLLSIAVPITVGSAGLQLLNVLEIGFYMGQLEKLFAANALNSDLMAQIDSEVRQLAEWSQQEHFSLMASNLKGMYNFAFTIFNMPCSFIIPINTSVLPAITSFLTLNDHKGVRATEESAARITSLMAAPCTIGLAILATPVMGLLKGYTGAKLAIAGQTMMLLGLTVFFYATVMFTNVLLQSHGKAHVPVINTLICGTAKLVAIYFLTGNPALGILGVPISSLLSYFFISVLNLICIRFLVPQKPRLLFNLLRALVPAGIMGAAVYFCHWALVNMAGITSNLLLCGIPIVVGVLVYLVFIVLTKAITKEDCMLLPKGEKIAKLLKL